MPTDNKPVVAGIGTIWAERRQVQVQWEVGTSWVRLVIHVPGRGWSELGTVAHLDSREPLLMIAAQHRDWCHDPVTRWQLVKQAQQDWELAWRRAARDDETDRITVEEQSWAPTTSITHHGSNSNPTAHMSDREV